MGGVRALHRIFYCINYHITCGLTNINCGGILKKEVQVLTLERGGTMSSDFAGNVVVIILGVIIWEGLIKPFLFKKKEKPEKHQIGREIGRELFDSTQSTPSVTIEVSSEPEDEDEDLSDEEDYTRHRDELNLTFIETAKIFFAKGKSGKEILSMEEDYNNFDFEDDGDREALFDTLRFCGLSDYEILKEAKSVFDVDPIYLVLASIENDVSIEDIVKFIKLHWTRDIKEVWETFDDSEIDLLNAIEILYALIPEDEKHFKKSSQKEVQSAKSEQTLEKIIG